MTTSATTTPTSPAAGTANRADRQSIPLVASASGSGNGNRGNGSGSSLVKCPRCGAFLGNRAGAFFLASWSHRQVLARDLRFLTCGDCGFEFSPLPVHLRAAAAADHRSIARILEDARAAPLFCPSTGCGKTLAMVGTVGAPVVVVQANRRQVVAAALIYASCPGCRAGWEPSALPMPSIRQ